VSKVPSLLRQNPIPVALPPAGAAARALEPFELERQRHDRWCWAAVGRAVLRFYDPTADVSQCALANAVLSRLPDDDPTRRTCCGTDGASPACNRSTSLELTLTTAGVLERRQTGPVSIGTIRTVVDANRVLCMRFEWVGGGAHFMVITDYGPSPGPRVLVQDPWLGDMTPRLADLTNGVYQDPDTFVGRGEWTDTYFTRPPQQ
jgi:hypothetical protein